MKPRRLLNLLAITGLVACLAAAAASIVVPWFERKQPKQSAWPEAEAEKIRHALLWSPQPPEPEPVRPPGYEPAPLAGSLREGQQRYLREGEELAVEMISLAIKYDDDLPRQLRNAAREIGADPATATRNIDAIRRVAKQRREVCRSLRASNPVLAQWYKDQKLAEVDDREGSFPPLERIARHWDSRLLLDP